MMKKLKYMLTFFGTAGLLVILFTPLKALPVEEDVIITCCPEECAICYVWHDNDPIPWAFDFYYQKINPGPCNGEEE